MGRTVGGVGVNATGRVIDSHVHFWDPAILRYPWLGDVPALNRPMLPRDYRPLQRCEDATVDANVDDGGAVNAVVFVEANCAPKQGEAEVAFVQRLTQHEPRIAGIVASLDLRDARARGAALARLRSAPRVVGVRHNIQGNPAGFALTPEFVRGAQAVGESGLTFDLCATADQLGDVVSLVAQCPATTFVLDHAGKPAIQHDSFGDWSVRLAGLAKLDNVVCKLSGLLSEARADQRNEAGIARYAHHVLACFGTHRVMYGSDWPVCTLAGGESVWRGLVARFTADWSSQARDAFYAANAIRIYRLNIHD